MSTASVRTPAGLFFFAADGLREDEPRSARLPFVSLRERPVLFPAMNEGYDYFAASAQLPASIWPATQDARQSNPVSVERSTGPPLCRTPPPSMPSGFLRSRKSLKLRD